MHAIILAAGVGRRLGEFGDNPKCLLEFGDKTLLERHISNLFSNNVTGVTLCVGYRRALIEAAIRKTNYRNVNTIVNTQYRQGSIVSLWSAREILRSGKDIVLMDADVLYSRELMSVLFRQPTMNRFLCDRDYEPGEEPVKICLNENRIVEFRKQLRPGLAYTDSGESVGFFSFTAQMASRLADAVDGFIAEDRQEEPYEEAIREIALRDPLEFVVEDVTGLPWVEIDFPEDITRAREIVLAQIDD
jgi:choline kinase